MRVAGKKLFKGIIINDTGEKIEYFRWAANAYQAYYIFKKKYNHDHGKEPWAFVKMDITEVKQTKRKTP